MVFAALLALVVLAAAEIYVIITIAHLIGGLLTAVLLILSTMGGLWLVRRERRRTWNALREALNRGMMPDRELADAAAILGGGVLIAIPGFITDVAGLFAVAPFTRPAVRGLLTRWVSRRATLGGPQMTRPSPRRSGDSRHDDRPDHPAAGGGQIVQGEVVEEHTGEPSGGTSSRDGRTADDGTRGRGNGTRDCDDGTRGRDEEPG
jgi:UPF0716 family protein affecting phage T7 exclusion